jgi:hypothetical protein
MTNEQSNEFTQALEMALSPLVKNERTLRINKGHICFAINFINLPPSRCQENRGGGAESENNRQLFFVDDRPNGKVKITQSINALPTTNNMRAKTAEPVKIALYLAKYLNEVAESTQPNFTHEDM